MTNTFTANKKDFVDKINAKYVATFYHQQHWLDKSKNRGTNTSICYLKNLICPEYDNADGPTQLIMELQKSIDILESKLEGVYVNNKVKSIVLYKNLTKGGTYKQDKDGQVVGNIAVCSLQIKPGAVKPFTRHINEKIKQEDKPLANLLNEVMYEWEKLLAKYYC